MRVVLPKTRRFATLTTFQFERRPFSLGVLYIGCPAYSLHDQNVAICCDQSPCILLKTQYFDSCLSQSHHKKWSGINPKTITSVQVKPRSGSAILWYNFLATGRGDRNALHAACPVGKNETKWSVNKQLRVGFWNDPAILTWLKNTL